jgi:hypothetical protein
MPTSYDRSMEILAGFALLIAMAVAGIAAAVMSVPLWIMIADEDEADD